MNRPNRRTMMAVLVAVLVLLVAGALDGMIERRLGSDAPELFDDTRIRLGESATIDGVEVSIDRMQSAQQLNLKPGEPPQRATGIYLVFRLRAETIRTERPQGLDGDLVVDGLRYAVQKLPTPDPDTVTQATAYAEIDPQRLRTAAARKVPVELRLWHTEVTYRYRQRLIVDLAVDPQRARALAEVPPQTTLEIGRPSSTGRR